MRCATNSSEDVLTLIHLDVPIQPTPDGIRATFFSNPFFRGPPAGYLDDETIDLKVEGISPLPGVPVQSFSVRWDGYLVPFVSGRYRLFTYADCGIRVFLDDSPIIVDRMPAPDEGAAFSEEPIQPLHPSGFTGVAKIFSGPQVGWMRMILLLCNDK